MWFYKMNQSIESTSVCKPCQIHLNTQLAKVFKQPNLQAESRHGITIGWQLVKNPQIQSKKDFEKNIDELNPHLSSTKELENTLLQLDRDTKEILHEKDLER